jgi:ketosteroid isomerase-like protein
MAGGRMTIDTRLADGPGAMVDRLLAATNAHDLDALADCFAIDYVNETPAHPSRGFSGREQVRRNWTQIFAGVADLRAEVVRRAVDGDLAWVEWDMKGTRRDGTPHAMRGVTVFRVVEGRAAWASFYLEPVDRAGDSVDDAVRQVMNAPAVPDADGARS